MEKRKYISNYKLYYFNKCIFNTVSLSYLFSDNEEIVSGLKLFVKRIAQEKSKQYGWSQPRVYHQGIKEAMIEFMMIYAFQSILLHTRFLF